MDTTELDQKIVEAEGQLTAARESAETICQHFLDVLGREIARWAPDSVKRVASQQHEVTQKLGSERLGALKTDLAALVERIPALVTKHVGEDRLWRHRPAFAPPKEGTAHRYEYAFYDDHRSGKPRYDAPDPLDEAVRRSITNGALLSLIRKYGFSGWSLGGGYEETYHHRFEWPEPVFLALRPYSAAAKRVDEAVRAVAAAKDAKGRAQADDLWDKA